MKHSNNYLRGVFAVIFFITVLACGAFASAEKLIEIDFNLLETLNNYVTDDESDLKEIPKNIQALNGKRVKVTGYFLVPVDAWNQEKPVASFAVSKNAYGCPCCSWGPSPTIFNTILVSMKEGTVLSKPFQPMVEVKGTFLIRKKQIPDVDGGKKLDVLFYIIDADAVKKKNSLF